MRYRETAKRLGEYRKQIAALRHEMRALQEKTEPEEVMDYTFQSAAGGTVRLAELFGDHDILFVVHNMGRNCPYCTLWADGFNGVFDHLSSRAAFVVSSPDPPEEQQRFAKSRDWRFPMVSHRGTSFVQDMGYIPPTVRFRASLCSSGRTARFYGSPTRYSLRATISVRSGISSA